MKSPAVIVIAGLLLFLVLTIVPTLLAKQGISRSLGIPNATNRKAAFWKGVAAEDILVVGEQSTPPSTGAIGRGTPPDTFGPNLNEESIEGAGAARQT